MPGKNFCPLLKKTCIEGKCKFWRHILGKDPQTGAELDIQDCSLALLPKIMLNVGKQINDLGGSIDSFRNEQSLNTLASVAHILDRKRQEKVLLPSNGKKRLK
jgi:hypothetical protein